MHVNKLGESGSADLFFEIMSRFNDRDNLEEIEKIASVIGRGVSEASGQLGQLSRITSQSGEAKAAVKATAEALGTGGKVSSEIASALANSAKQVQGSVAMGKLGGISRLVGGSSKTARLNAFMTIRKDLSAAVKNMLRQDGRYIDDYIDAAGNFKQLGLDELYAAARKSNGAVSNKAADELVDGFLSGKVYDEAYTGGPVQKALRQEAQAAADAAGAARVTDDAAGAARVTDDAAGAAGAAKGTDGVIKNPGKLSLEDLAAAKNSGGFKHIEDIQKLTSSAKSGRVAGDAASKFKNARDTLDEAAKIASKITPDSVRTKVQFYIQDLRVAVVNSEVATKKIIQAGGDINLQGARFGDNARITYVQQAAIGDMNKLLNAMDADLTRFSMQLGQVKRARKGLNEVAEEIATGGRGTGRATGGASDASATGGRATGGGGGGGGTGGRGGDTHINIGGGGSLGDNLGDAANPALKAYVDAQQAAMQQQINYLVKNGDNIALELKNLRTLSEAGGPGASAAGKLHDDFVKVIQRMENIGNVNISGKLLKELSEAGVTGLNKQTSWWGKAAKVFGWLGVITVGAAGGHYLYQKFKDPSGGGAGGGAYGPDGDHDGDGIPNRLDPDWPGNKRPETQEPDHYIGVTDPAARESLEQADPSSPKYDSRNGWQAANNTIMNLQATGRTGDLKAYLDALQLAYRKRFRMKLDPPFVVPGSPVPLHYAFLNQHRAPAPNLAESTGRTLAIKTMVLNDGLNDPDQEGPVEVFDVNYRLMNGDAQKAINFTAEETVAKGLAERGRPWYHFGIGSDRHTGRSRSRSHSMGEEIDSETGMAGQRSRQMTNADRLMIQRILDSRGSDRLSGLKKFAELSSEDNAERLTNLECLANIANNSTNITKNTDNQTLEKKADDFSKSYCKDAVTDLNHTDKTLRSYFTGLGGLYDQRLEKRKADFKTLYNVTDETGEDLIYEAHPKEVVVSDSIGRGGLVENGLEQKRQTHGVALSAPTGNYRANYASRYDALKKLAN